MPIITLLTAVLAKSLEDEFPNGPAGWKGSDLPIGTKLYIAHWRKGEGGREYLVYAWPTGKKKSVRYLAVKEDQVTLTGAREITPWPVQ